MMIQKKKLQNLDQTNKGSIHGIAEMVRKTTPTNSATITIEEDIPLMSVSVSKLTLLQVSRRRISTA